MASITTKSFVDLVRGQAAAIQARASGLVDVSVGSVVRALIESVAGVALWIQALILQVLAITRASTSTGADLDSWMADWFFTRLPAQAASGVVTFSRFTSTGQVVVPVGATVETADGTQRYVVIADSSDLDYSAALGGYPMANGITTVTVPVQGLSLSAAGNALAGTVNTITSAIAGVDRVTNAANFINGADAESDAAFRLRFLGYIQALREATPAALLYYVRSMAANVQAVLVENLTLAGQVKRGFIYLVVDDGSGAPPASLVAAASLVVDKHRAAGIEFGVYGATTVSIAAAGTLAVVAGADKAAAAAAVAAAWKTYLSTLPLEAPAVYTRLFQLAYDASPDVTAVSSVTLNGSTVDVTPARGTVIKPGAITVTAP